MIDPLVAFIQDESKWPAVSMGSALLAVAILLRAHRSGAVPARRRILAAMNLYFGVMIGTLALGHLLSVSVKLAVGTLEGSTALFYGIGLALALPSWWLTGHTRRVLQHDADHGRATVALNLWLSVTLLAMGLHNLPLAVPGVLGVGYHLHSRRAVGWILVGLVVAGYVALFVGSMMFFVNGQSFEQSQQTG